MKPFPGATHLVRFYGIPAYARIDCGGEGSISGVKWFFVCDMQGTNWFFDWLIVHFCPWMHFLCEFVLGVMGRESSGQFRIEVVRTLSPSETTEKPKGCRIFRSGDVFRDVEDDE